jgi:hypothetical protein
MSIKDTNRSSVLNLNGKMHTNCMVFLTKIQTWLLINPDFLDCNTVESLKWAKTITGQKQGNHTIRTAFFITVRTDIQSSVTLNLPMEEPAALTAKIFIAIGVLLFGLIFYISMQIIWVRLSQNIKGRSRKNFYQILIRFLMAVVMALLAILIPNLQIFISLFGTFCSRTLSFFIPILIETIYLYPNGYGIFRWKLIVNSILFCLYILVVVSGSYENIIAIMKLYS